MTLKWALLKRLERPLQHEHSEQFSSLGISSGLITVKCDCDSTTFRQLTSQLVRKYNVSKRLVSNEKTPSRISFSPSYSTILDGSTSSNNMVIAFHMFSDITDLLGIRNEDDY